MKGILRKLHKYPVCYTETPDPNEATIKIFSGNYNYDKICSISGEKSLFEKILFYKQIDLY